MPVSISFISRWPTSVTKISILFFRWQDLKDEIRAQTKIECSFCEIHTPRDREGIGKMSKWDFVIYFLFSLLQQKRWNEGCAQTYGWIWIERTKIRTPTCKYDSYLWLIFKRSFGETNCQRVEADLVLEVDQPHQRNDPDPVADLEVDLEALLPKDRSDPAAEAQNQKLVMTATRIEMILTRAGVNTFFLLNFFLE